MTSTPPPDREIDAAYIEAWFASDKVSDEEKRRVENEITRILRRDDEPGLADD